VLERSDRARRAARASRLGAPYLVPLALALGAAVALWAGWDRLTTFGVSLESTESQIRRALANQGRAHLEDVYGFKSGGTLELSRVTFGDLAVREGEERADVIAVVEAEGRAAWRDEAATVAYVGRERFSMTPCSIALWCGDGRQFARLRGVLTTLFRREDAFNGRDAEAYARLVSDAYRERGGKAALLAQLRADLRRDPPARMRVLGWQIRVEHDRAVVGEDYEIRVGDAPPRGLRARFELVLEDDRWTIVSGL
jgi:hypothetical protein